MEKKVRYTIFTTTTFYLCHDGEKEIQRPLVGKKKIFLSDRDTK